MVSWLESDTTIMEKYGVKGPIIGDGLLRYQ